MTRDDERIQRARRDRSWAGCRTFPGSAPRMRPDARPRRPPPRPGGRGARQRLPGATLRRAEREMLATAVSAGNDCFFCMDSHARIRHRAARARRRRRADAAAGGAQGRIARRRSIRRCGHCSTSPDRGRRNPLELTAADVEAAKAPGRPMATCSWPSSSRPRFSMYNRLVDGLRAMTPPTTEAYAGSPRAGSPSTGTARPRRAGRPRTG